MDGWVMGGRWSRKCSMAERPWVWGKCRTVPLPYLFVSCLSRFSLLCTIICMLKITNCRGNRSGTYLGQETSIAGPTDGRR